ncbi:hypothetical protein FOL47_004879 [Perkinsus chesapeaki]|uniref:Isopenicillin N synthase-like Fe(2+) 2OG dioxygenase domain-containing protein n=1 Tax=Perkinsus chesapeaki TaxID=330153 RepID=A0A7J6M0J0_PERCH|nr:hypothetical protein FOL47_004879 [Perkinsus chesapeaki]
MIPPLRDRSPLVFTYDDESELMALDGVTDVDGLVVTELKLRGFVLVRHESSRLLKTLLGATSNYFDRDEEEKMKIAGGATMRKAQGRPVGYSRRGCGEFVDLHAIRDQSSVSFIPEGFNHGGFKAPLVAHIMHAANIAKALCACIARSLGGEGLIMRLMPHLSLFWCEAIAVVAARSESCASPGLEILSPQNHQWEPVDRFIADGKTVVVFPGDFMSIVTNDAIPAAAHRSIRGPTSSRRISIPVLFRTLPGSFWPPGVGGQFLNCDEPISMDDIDTYCEYKRKSNAARHKSGGDKDWILKTRTTSVRKKPST